MQARVFGDDGGLAAGAGLRHIPAMRTKDDYHEKLDAAETWIFDLDNTLYPATCNLFAQVDKKMGAFISAYLGVGLEEARVIQKRYFREHGTTLNGLMTHHGMDPAEFLACVHDIDYSPVQRNEDLVDAIQRLPGRKVIFTNGTVQHANSVLDRLGIKDEFEVLFDIVASDYVPKPNPAPYDKLLAAHDINPTTAVMLEDIARNLEHPAALGMMTVWVRTDHDWSHDGVGAGDHIHHVTDDLAEWLSGYVRRRIG